MHIHYLQHDPLDGPGELTSWASQHGHQLSGSNAFDAAPSSKNSGEAPTSLLPPSPWPNFSEIDLLVILGGPMGAYDEESHPWLAKEKEFLRQAAASGLKILGLCLGCQLLADALGGRAFRHSCKEFGWQPIEPTAAGKIWFPLPAGQQNFSAFQWHGDTYELPPQAIQLARNAACEQQAFLIGNQILGLQFHLEWNEQIARVALAEEGVAPPPGPYIQSAREILASPELFQEGRKRFFALLDRFVSQKSYDRHQ